MPPGTYSPTRSSGVTRWPSVVPSASVNCHDFARCRSWCLRIRAAACDIASPSSRFNPERAFSSSGRNGSRSASRATLNPSKRSVYSSTAASPLARTPARIAATSSSTFWSNIVSNAVGALRRASKSGSVVESRAISNMLSRGLRELVEQGLNVVAPELEGRLVDDEAGADRPDLLDRAQAVGAQRIAAGDQINDRVGQTHERRELHRALKADPDQPEGPSCPKVPRGLAR